MNDQRFDQVFISCSFPVSLHPHGVKYDQENEGGGAVADASKIRPKVGINAGEQRVYTWTVPERAGPASMDVSSVAWMYHSHVDEVADTLAGLNGFIIITAKGKAKADGTPVDVDREVFSLYKVFNEQSVTQLYDANVAKFTPERPAEIDHELGEVHAYIF